jgi:hypothetical protein
VALICKSPYLLLALICKNSVNNAMSVKLPLQTITVWIVAVLASSGHGYNFSVATVVRKEIAAPFPNSLRPDAPKASKHSEEFFCGGDRAEVLSKLLRRVIVAVL